MKQEADVIQENMGMVHHVAKRFRGAIGNGLDYDDLVSLGTLGLIRAYRRYDPNRAAFSTFAIPYIRGEIQQFLRDKLYSVRVPRKIIKHIRPVVSLDRTTPTTEGLTMLEMLPDTADFSGADVREFLSYLTPVEKTAIKMRMEGEIQSQIGRRINHSQVQVSRILNQIKVKYLQFQAGELNVERHA